MDFYTCNGSPKGCERERFGFCGYHDASHRYSVTAEVDGITAGHKVAADGMAEAVDKMHRRFDAVRILSIVEVE